MKTTKKNEFKVVAAITSLNVIQYPTGRFGFVGRVPRDLSYAYLDGSPISEQDAKDVASFGPGLFRKRIKTVSFATRDEAVAAAAALGFTVAE